MKKGLLVALILLSSYTGYCQNQENDKSVSSEYRVYQHIQKGLSYHDKKEYEKALEEYSKAIGIATKDNNAGIALHNRASAYHNLGKYSEAITDYTKAIEINPMQGNGVSYYGRGFTYWRMGKLKEAMADYAKTIEMNPGYIDAHFGKALIHSKLGEYDQAIESYNKVIESQPEYKSGACHYKRGNAYFYQDRFKEAIQDYIVAIRHDPKNVAAYCNRASAYFNDEQYEKAIDDFSKTINMNPAFGNGISYKLRASSYYKTGRFREALPDYNKAIEFYPDDALLYADRGNVYYQLTEYAKAKEDYKKAEEIAESDEISEIARKNREIAEMQIAASEQKDKQKNLQFTEEEMEKITDLEKDWATRLDGAGINIQEKKFVFADSNIQKSLKALEEIRKILDEKGIDPNDVGRLKAMKKMSLTFDNLSKVSAFAENEKEALKKKDEIKNLVSESYEHLKEAEDIFKQEDAPNLSALCQKLRNALKSQIDKIESNSGEKIL